MIPFRNTNEKNVGRADVMGLVTLVDGHVDNVIGRPVNVLFLVRLTFRSGHEFFIDKVPTGVYPHPYRESPDDFIVTDGEDLWESIRHKTPEQLEESGEPIDPLQYVQDELAPRMQRLTLLDKQHIIEKIRKYCDDLQKDEPQPGPCEYL